MLQETKSSRLPLKVITMLRDCSRIRRVMLKRGSCSAELKSLRSEKSVFTFNLKDDLPIFGDGDTDLDRHLESFQDVCLVVKPSSDREKLRLFARTLKGTRRRCYDTIVKEAKSSGDYEVRPNVVYDRVVAALDASFHESAQGDESPS